jgi:hypothetical protein
VRHRVAAQRVDWGVFPAGVSNQNPVRLNRVEGCKFASVRLLRLFAARTIYRESEGCGAWLKSFAQLNTATNNPTCVCIVISPAPLTYGRCSAHWWRGIYCMKITRTTLKYHSMRGPFSLSRLWSVVSVSSLSVQRARTISPIWSPTSAGEAGCTFSGPLNFLRLLYDQSTRTDKLAATSIPFPS